MQIISGLIAAAIAIITAAVSAGITYGVLKTKIMRIDKIEKKLDGNGSPSAFVTRSECTETHKTTDDVLRSLHKKARAFENFARWYLISKEGKSLPEVNEILAGE